MLKKGLSPIYSYHNVAHTIDVARQALVIAAEEHLNDPEQLAELQLAAWYHDTGFLQQWQNHEEQSCITARSDLAAFDVSPLQLDKICEVIMATKLPHNPIGISQEIICDADLDYLGREDFFIISDRLRQEFLACGIVKTNEEWHAQQISFLQNHRYFTASSNKRRNPLKQQHIQFLLQATYK